MTILDSLEMILDGKFDPRRKPGIFYDLKLDKTNHTA